MIFGVKGSIRAPPVDRDMPLPAEAFVHQGGECCGRSNEEMQSSAGRESLELGKY